MSLQLVGVSLKGVDAAKANGADRNREDTGSALLFRRRLASILGAVSVRSDRFRTRARFQGRNLAAFEPWSVYLGGGVVSMLSSRYGQGGPGDVGYGPGGATMAERAGRRWRSSRGLAATGGKAGR